MLPEPDPPLPLPHPAIASPIARKTIIPIHRCIVPPGPENSTRKNPKFCFGLSGKEEFAMGIGDVVGSDHGDSGFVEYGIHCIVRLEFGR